MGYFFVMQDSNFGKDLEGNYFHIFKRFDVEGVKLVGMGVKTKSPPSCSDKIKQLLFLHFVSRFYAQNAGAAAWSSPERGTLASIKRECGIIINTLAPTVKIRFLPEEISTQFEDDPLMLGSALRTKKPISTDHLGLRGIFIQGARGNLRERISQNVSKSLYGLIRLISLPLITAFGIYYLTQATSQERQANQLQFM